MFTPGTISLTGDRVQGDDSKQCIYSIFQNTLMQKGYFAESLQPSQQFFSHVWAFSVMFGHFQSCWGMLEISM